MVNPKNKINWKISSSKLEQVIQKEVARGLRERFSLINFKPKVVLYTFGNKVSQIEVGKEVKKKAVLQINLVKNIDFVKRKKNVVKAAVNDVISDESFLPFLNNSIDLIIAGIHFSFCNDPVKVLAEYFRVLNFNGLILFTAFGPDTLKEVQETPILPWLIDTHDLGDLLTKTGFTAVVLDVDYFHLQYQEETECFNELKAMRLIHSFVPYLKWHPSLPKCNLRFEIIYAHAFKEKPLGEINRQEQNIFLHEIKYKNK